MKTILLLILLAISQSVFAFDVSLGVHRPFDKTQDSSGKDESDPFSPTISIGHAWNIFSNELFAPRLGYIRQTNNTNDRYGGDYTVESYFLLYDFLHPLNLSRSLFLRYGFGTFQKKTKGQGGTVTIPNGTGTATAYRPDTSKSSTTLTANLGLDYKLGIRGDTFSDQSLMAELLIFQPFDKQKRLLSLMMTYGLYF